MVVGAYLRSLRRSRDMTLRDAGRVIRGSAAKLSRLETGISPQRDPDVAGLLGHYKLNPSVIRATCGMVRAPRRDQWADFAPGWPARLAACEQEASAVRVYTMYLIPDILQIPAYTALIPDPEGTRSVPRALPPGQADITLLLDESVLQRPFGAPAVVAAQIAHLQDRIATGELTVRVVPLAAGIYGYSTLMSELTLHGRKLVVDDLGTPLYSAGAPGRTRCKVLDSALDAAISAERSAEILEETRNHFEQLAAEWTQPQWPPT
ncbi:helix-turn-helix domain-containing protein [Streptomyces bingchenggensis BCW-1]|uniref:Helix-turn-helix domain-containing protein n=2 Tax=Streptomyces TaxID=1883 RepID=D7BU97_STRBB|nr:helix-turn-helix domain-containing protein [Streptomyces bingchenggensis BCW-1]